MEDLDESLFDYLLGFLDPKNACKLAVLSTTLRDWVERSLCWETWCEQDCPSLTTPIAKELVKMHYGSERSRGYKQLFQRLSLERSSELEPGCNRQIENESLSDFVMLVDIYLNDEGILFCSVESSELGQKMQGCRKPDCQDFEECGAVLKGAHKSVRQERLCATLLQKMIGFEQVYQNTRKPAAKVTKERILQVMRKPDVISFSWKLMRKADGKIQTLLDRAVPEIWESWIHGPGSFYLRAVRMIRNVEASMHLVCNDGEPRLLKYLKAGAKVPANSVLQRFTVHVNSQFHKLGSTSRNQTLPHSCSRTCYKGGCEN